MKKNLIVQNLNLVYIDHGTGPTLLFLHGWGTAASSFDPLIEQLSNYRCVSLSFPGFGGSEQPPTAWSVLDYSQLVHDFIDKLDLAPMAIIAHSMGGRVSIKGLAAGLLEPPKLILIASAGAARKSLKTKLVGLIAKVAKPVMALPPLAVLRQHLLQSVGSRDYKNAGEMRDTFIKIINENLEADASQIKIPTLLIWGDKDTETPLAEAKILHQCIANSKLEVITDATHFVFQEQPELVSQKIKGFL